MSEYIITDEQINELNRALGGMQIVTSWLSAYAVFDTLGFPPKLKSKHLAITLPEVVRCRDCKHYGIVSETYDCDPIYGCHKLSFSNAPITSELREPQDDNGFCAWGERKADE